MTTIERRVSGLIWTFAQHGETLDRKNPAIASTLKELHQTHKRPRRYKEPVQAKDVIRMAETLDRDLRGLRDRAILLVGFAGGLRRCEIVGLDIDRGETTDGIGRLHVFDRDLILMIRGERGYWREVQIGPGSSPISCPVSALMNWLHYARIEEGPVFRRVSQDGTHPLPARLSGGHVAKLVKRTALAAGVRSDVAEDRRGLMFSGHSLRSGCASSDIGERLAQLHLHYASPVMIREYQSRRAASQAEQQENAAKGAAKRAASKS